MQPRLAQPEELAALLILSAPSRKLAEMVAVAAGMVVVAAAVPVERMALVALVGSVRPMAAAAAAEVAAAVLAPWVALVPQRAATWVEQAGTMPPGQARLELAESKLRARRVLLALAVGARATLAGLPAVLVVLETTIQPLSGGLLALAGVAVEFMAHLL